MNKAILVTGGAGFIGSAFLEYFSKKYPDYTLVNFDKLTYAGDLENTKACQGRANYYFVQGDICDACAVSNVLEKYSITDIVHFAAESHVDNSIESPRAFVETNVMGTFTLLEAFRCVASRGRFHHISTDEVYGSLGETGKFHESTPYSPNSPYSATKASSDFLVRAYFHTYGLDVVTSNCSNNFGPRQHSEKLIPTIIRTALSERPIPIYGSGTNIRDWLYVDDHVRALDLIFHAGMSGEHYNVGADNERTNLQIANTICDILDGLYKRNNGNYRDLITFVADRPGHDMRYAIDATKLKTELGWQPQESFDSAMHKTVQWYVNKFNRG